MELEKLADNLTGWIRERVETARGQGLVLGLSGGIDSAVLGVLCKRAFPDNTLGLIMPCGSIQADEEHALLLAGKFSIETRKIALDEAFEALLRAYPDFSPAPAAARLAQANLKARLRMLSLYYTANQLNYLVAGSSNRSELSIGYFTKHGDSGVDMLPLGSLLKERVRALAKYLGVPDIIIDKPPSAGLWEGQTDEGEMGCTYADLDCYLKTGEANPELKSMIDARYAASRHKCEVPPIAPFA